MRRLRVLLGNALGRALDALTKPRVIMDAEGRTPYLSRYYLRGRPVMPDGSDPITRTGHLREGAETTKSRWDVGVYLHHFHRSDMDYELHSHPWSWAFSIILSGGYLEERRVSFSDDNRNVATRVLLPFSLNVLTEHDYHRAELLNPEKGAWTLFVTGPRVSSWNFWDRETGKTTPWREFIKAKQRASVHATNGAAA